MSVFVPMFRGTIMTNNMPNDMPNFVPTLVPIFFHMVMSMFRVTTFRGTVFCGTILCAALRVIDLDSADPGASCAAHRNDERTRPTS